MMRQPVHASSFAIRPAVPGRGEPAGGPAAQGTLSFLPTRPAGITRHG